MQRKQNFSISLLLSYSILFLCTPAKSQVALSLSELSSFQNPSANWRIAGDVTSDLKENGVLRVTEGTGVLANVPDKKNAAADLYTAFQHSDIDLELDYMMAKGSNSGIYLQGRYEVQLLDSWGKRNPAAGDNGGIYERWDDARGKGAEGYQGYAPRQNASRAPGLWQNLKISFQAPRFDGAGKKIENARMLRVVLNGVTIHENVELLGPTRGGPNNEVAMGPLRIQGDHGAVAFRNIRYTNFSSSRPELTNLTYKVYKGKFEKEPEFAKLPPEAQGSTTILSSDINKIDNEFIIRYTGTLDVKAAGEYNFNLRAPGGNGSLKIDNKAVVPSGESGSGVTTLPVGKLPFELSYAKYVSWAKAALALSVSGPGIREFVLSDINTGVNDVVDPILIDAAVNTTLRSFMDIPAGKRVVHAVNVGSSQQVHFTYDLDRGMLLQAWRGGFLDATPMWHDRGNGSSRPVGAVLHFGEPVFLLQKLANAQSPWSNDSAGTAFRTRGYEMDEADRPAFLYAIYGIDITDDIKVLETGEGLRRTLTVQNGGEGLYARLAAGKTIEALADGLYLIDDKRYYLQIEDAEKAKPVIRDAAGRKELIIPVQTKLTYSVLFSTSSMNNHYSFFSRIALLKWVAVFLLSSGALAQESPKEEDYFKIAKVSAPEGVVLEVGGLAVLPNGDLGISTRRGDVYIVENPTSRRPYFRKFASGLHEVLGLVYKDGALYCAQRGELTKLVDRNKDGKADLYQTVFSWPISGHYHEYSFGPKLAPDGSFFVSANVAFGDEQWWRGESRVPWRGWMMRITEDGKMEPWATGLRSPCGLGMIDGELFYDDNQGDWIGSGGIVHLKKGAFAGHPAGLRWSGMPNSPINLSTEQLYNIVGPREDKNDRGRYIKPENVVNEKFVTLSEAKQKVPQIQLPAVWLPHGVLGISNSEILKIPEGVFGPYSGQVLVGDQGQSKISRVFMEKVNGEFQGAAWEFRSGFQSGVLRMAWANDGSLFVGETNRGWGSAGEANQGLQRLIWNGTAPFEMRTMKAMPDGFEIEFTRPVDKRSAEDIASYSVESFTYKYHPVYGSPTVNNKKHGIKGVKVSADGMTARILVDNPRRYYIHNVTLDGVRSKEGSYSLVHPTGYYTLNNIPEGRKLLMSEVSTKNSGTSKQKATAPKGQTTTGTPDDPANRKKVSATTTGKETSFADVNRLLIKNTCAACHSVDKKQVGPAFKDIAKRNYPVNKIVNLIYNPQPQNWPGYATEMPPMPQVPKVEARKIATWIRSLK